MALDRKWLHAQLNLAWKVVVHYVAKLWPWSQRFGLERFQENYVVEGLPPATASFRDLAHQPGRCTTCGACDAACPLLRTDRDFMGPMAFVVAGARAAPHLDDVRETLAVLTDRACADCRRCELACPEDIPILAIAHHLAAQRVVVQQARAGTLPITAADLKRGALPMPPHTASPSPLALPPSSSASSSPSSPTRPSGMGF